MRNLLWCVVVVAGAMISTSVLAKDGQFQNEFLKSCSKSMTEPPQGLPQVLASNICQCTVRRITRNVASRLVLKVAADTHDYSAFQPDMKACVNRELPKYMQSHPDFLQSYLRAHPELLNRQ